MGERNQRKEVRELKEIENKRERMRERKISSLLGMHLIQEMGSLFIINNVVTFTTSFITPPLRCPPY